MSDGISDSYKGQITTTDSAGKIDLKLTALRKANVLSEMSDRLEQWGILEEFPQLEYELGYTIRVLMEDAQ